MKTLIRPVILATGLVAMTAMARDTPESPPPTLGDPPSAAEMEDLEFVASQRGITVEEAISRVAWRDDFAIATSAIREQFGQDFAAAEIDGDGTAWVGFKGDAPEKAEELIQGIEDELGIGVDIRPNLGFSEIELEQLIVDVHYAVLDTPGVANAVTTHDVATGEIVSTVVMDAEQKFEADMFSSVVERASGLTDISVRVRSAGVDTPIGSDDAATNTSA